MEKKVSKQEEVPASEKAKDKVHSCCGGARKADKEKPKKEEAKRPVRYPRCAEVSFDNGRTTFPVFMPSAEEAYAPLAFSADEETGVVLSGWFPVDLKERIITVPTDEIAKMSGQALETYGFEGINVFCGEEPEEDSEELDLYDDDDFSSDDIDDGRLQVVCLFF